MATPIQLDLVKTGIDLVVKTQTKNGKLTFETIAPSIQHREGFYRLRIITGFGDAGAYGNGVAVPSDRKYSLYEENIYPTRFAKAWEYDLHDKDEDVYNQLAENVGDIAVSMRRRKNKEAANLFNNGFDSNFAIYDGQPLFSTAHPGAVGIANGSNRPASGSSLGSIAVESAIAAYMGQLDPRGESMEFEGNLELHVGNLLFPLATRIVEASGLAGTNDNDPNFAGRYVTVRKNDKITSSTAQYYKAASQDEHKLRTIQFSPYRITNQTEARTEIVVNVVSERYTMFVGQWQGTYADPGA